MPCIFLQQQSCRFLQQLLLQKPAGLHCKNRKDYYVVLHIFAIVDLHIFAMHFFSCLFLTWTWITCLPFPLSPPQATCPPSPTRRWCTTSSNTPSPTPRVSEVKCNCWLLLVWKIAIRRIDVGDIQLLCRHRGGPN